MGTGFPGPGHSISTYRLSKLGTSGLGLGLAGAMEGVRAVLLGRWVGATRQEPRLELGPRQLFSAGHPLPSLLWETDSHGLHRPPACWLLMEWSQQEDIRADYLRVISENLRRRRRLCSQQPH